MMSNSMRANSIQAIDLGRVVEVTIYEPHKATAYSGTLAEVHHKLIETDDGYKTETTIHLAEVKFPRSERDRNLPIVVGQEDEGITVDGNAIVVPS
jgi:hypothetical protein